MSSPLRAGFATADVTPDLGCRLYGYPQPDRTADAVGDPLYVRALVLEQGGLLAAWIVLDWCMIEDDTVAAYRAAIAARTGIPPAHVTLGVIQTHSGPATQSAHGWGDRDVAYLERCQPVIVDAVAAAQAALRPARLAIGTTQSDVGVNRREVLENHGIGLGYNPWGPYDPTMTVLRLQADDGPVVSIVHYGAHPTSQGAVRFISRDWPGVLVDRLEAVTGGPAMFINGAVGDVGPRLSVPATTGDGAEASREVGYRAAAHAARALRGLRDWRDVELAVHCDEILLPYAALPPLAEAEAQMAAAEPDRESWGTGMCNYTYWKAVTEAHEQPRPAGAHWLQTITRLGPVAFVPLPGEPFAEILLRLRHRSPFAHTLCASTTNGAKGYFVTREARARGGYEVWVARAFGAFLLAEDIDDVLVAGNLRLLRAMAEGCERQKVGV
ncbi:MAG: neutral/alkaline non-lysosomal ceramidase N-terminal domain-containing protein [Armatimonadetes bacterium]|nr:neutral/alkaline non-lysosomal ceramidase N-terminal domain-containing protein [Armatimonadota bacterium]